MCGILGGINYQNNDKIISWMQSSLPLMSDRGPDSLKYKVFNNFALGATRLRIFDNSEIADQPYFDRINSNIIVFNGAILNYKSLRKELLSEGVIFDSSSDTEVLLKAYSSWGLKRTLSKIRGMFAFAIYDIKNNIIVIARDHFGIKPLFFLQDKNSLAFSSTIKPLLLFPCYNIEVNKEVIPEQFAFQCIKPPNTIYKNIFSIMPGHYSVINILKNEKVKTKSFWKISDCLNDDNFSKLTNFDDMIKEVVISSWQGDRRKGLQLSGGLDSSLIAAISRENFSNSINTFSIIFEDKNKISFKKSEEKYMNFVNSKFNLKPNYFLFEDNQVSTILRDAIITYEMPLYSANSVLQFLHAKFIKNETELLLTGEGADDIFLGYYNNVEDDLSSVLKMYITKDHLNSLFGKDGFQKAINSRYEIWSDSLYKSLSAEKKLIILTVQTILHGLLARHDKMYMSNGIEGRPVYCDLDILKYALNTDVKNIFKKGLGKILLRQIAKKYFDSTFIYRKKQWLSGSVSDWCANYDIWGKLIKSIDLDIISEYINPMVFNQINNLDDNVNEKWLYNNLTILFSTLNFSTWHSTFIENDFRKFLV